MGGKFHANFRPVHFPPLGGGLGYPVPQNSLRQQKSAHNRALKSPIMGMHPIFSLPVSSRQARRPHFFWVSGTSLALSAPLSSLRRPKRSAGHSSQVCCPEIRSSHVKQLLSNFTITSAKIQIPIQPFPHGEAGVRGAGRGEDGQAVLRRNAAVPGQHLYTHPRQGEQGSAPALTGRKSVVR